MNRISPKAMALLTAGGLLALTGCSTEAAGAAEVSLLHHAQHALVEVQLRVLE